MNIRATLQAVLHEWRRRVQCAITVLRGKPVMFHCTLEDHTITLQDAGYAMVVGNHLVGGSMTLNDASDVMIVGNTIMYSDGTALTVNTPAEDSY